MNWSNKVHTALSNNKCPYCLSQISFSMYSIEDIEYCGVSNELTLDISGDCRSCLGNWTFIFKMSKEQLIENAYKLWFHDEETEDKTVCAIGHRKILI